MVGPFLTPCPLLTFTIIGKLLVAFLGWIASLAIFIHFKGIPVYIEKQTGFREILPTAQQLYNPLISITFFRGFVLQVWEFIFPPFWNVKLPVYGKQAPPWKSTNIQVSEQHS